MFPAVKVDDDKTIDMYYELIDRVYTVIVQHRFDRVEVNFTVNGKKIVKPGMAFFSIIYILKYLPFGFLTLT